MTSSPGAQARSGCGWTCRAAGNWWRASRESVELLALAQGQAVLALCKATAVTVTRGAQAAIAAGRNLLAGHAARVSRGDTGDEVAAQLDAGLQLVGFAPAGSKIRSGGRVMVAVDESAVVIAVAG
ncbi:MAG TPA: hypothetical protein VLI46_08125 [Ramlibacter sp.]|nr:hypothetical protein [Ramlibacter sp.]